MRFRTLFFLVIVLALAALPALAQETATSETTPAPPPEKSVGPQVVPIPEIATTMAQSRLRLDEIIKTVTPERVITSLENELDDMESEIDALKTETESPKIEEFSLNSINDLRQKWKNVEAQLGEWSTTLVSRLREMDDLHTELDASIATWKVTRDSTSKDDIPPETLSKVETYLSDVADVKKNLNTRREAVLLLQDRVTDWRVDSTSLLSTLDAAAVEKRRGLFTQDSPVLWKAIARGVQDSSHVMAPSRPGPVFLSALQSFVHLYLGRIIFTAALLLAFVVMLIALRRRTLNWETEDENLQRALRMSRRPVAVGLVLTGAFAEQIFPRAQLLVYELFSVVVLLSSLDLVRYLMPANLVKASRGVLLVVLIYFAASSVYPSGLPNRLLFLSIAAVALAGVIWWLMSGHRRPNLPASWAKVTSGARIAGVLLVLSLIANVVGAVALAETLALGAIAAAYWGVVIYVTATALTGVFVLLLRTRSAWTPNFVRNHSNLIQRRLARWIDIAAVVVWIITVLGAFRMWQPVREGLRDFFETHWTVGTITISVASIVLFFVMIWVSILVSRLIRFVLDEDILPRMPLKRGVPAAILMFTNYSIVTIGFILAMAILGFQPSQFTLIGGALGVGLGFGLQTLVNNFVSGLILIFERPIQVGDTVEFGTPPLLGAVRSIGIRASIIRTWSGAEVIVPNGNLLAGHLTNWTLSDQMRRMEMPVSVAYGTDPNQVIELLKGVATDRTGVLKDPEPYVLFKGFGESSLDFELRAWTTGGDWFLLASAMKVEIYDALTEANITIPFPQRDLHLRSVDPGIDLASGAESRAGDTSKNDD